MPERRISKYHLREREGKKAPTVRLDTVDAALQQYDGYETLSDLYPELYEDS